MVTTVEIYCDGAGLAQMKAYADDRRIAGFTCNPTLMKQAGISDYRLFADAVLGVIGDKPVSFEVLADDFATMERQARAIASWGPNVYVKLPITNTRGESIVPLLGSLSDLNLNITAVMTAEQLNELGPWLAPTHIVSVFAGRIMDTGRLPPEIIPGRPSRTLWASAREVYHVLMAEEYGYDIITLSPELISKLDQRGRDLTAYSLETVKQFHADGMGIEF